MTAHPTIVRLSGVEVIFRLSNVTLSGVEGGVEAQNLKFK